MTLVVRRAGLADIFALRHAVLRPGRKASASVYGKDLVAVHMGAWEVTEGGTGMLVGCATVFHEPWAGPPPEPGAWRLRGMAVDPSRQRSGVGRQLLEGVVSAARDDGATLLWANARTTALPFYLGQGWTVAGAEFVTPDTGLPHRPIVLSLLGVGPSA